MTPETWQRARSVLAAALDAPPEDRPALVAARCGDDLILLREVESLLLGWDHPHLQTAHVPGPGPTGCTGEPPPLAPTDLGKSDEPGSAAHGVTPGDEAVDVWGDFVLLHELGRGGFGVVHRAWDRSLKRDLALKIINVSRLPRSRGDILVREGQMLARIRHPNVVGVYGVQRRGVEVGLAMEYIRGRTLAEIIGLNGPMSAQEAATIGVTLCDALAQVHRTGLVHRDVKAANVMREPRGRIVLMDFGAGHELVAEGDTASVIVGTPLYMSPEVLEGRTATPASDIYSLGVLLFHLVTGEFPVNESHLGDLMAAHRAGSRRSLASLRSDLPAAFVEAVERSLATSRSQRPPTALALRAELARVRHDNRHGRRLVIPPTVPPPRPAATVLLTSVLAATGVVLLCSIAGFVTTLEYNYVLARSEEFAMESWAAPPYWGARVLLPSVIYTVAAIVIVNTVALAARLVTLAVPPLGRLAVRLAAPVTERVRRAGVHEARPWCQTLCVASAVALCTIVAVFAPMLAGLAENISTGDASSLATLSEDYRPAHQQFRVALTLLLAALVGGLLRVRTTAMRSMAGAGVHLASSFALIGVVLVILAVPWRVIREPEFREATWNGRPCFVLGSRDTELLMHCPSLPSPRNRVVSASDPQLVVHDRVSDLFAAYARQATSATLSR